MLQGVPPASTASEEAQTFNNPEYIDDPTAAAAVTTTSSSITLPCNSVTGSKLIKRENIRVDVTEDEKPTSWEIGRGHFAIVYKGKSQT